MIHFCLMLFWWRNLVFFFQILEIPANESDTCQEEPPRCVSTSLECELTRMEFADILGLKASSSFVQQMFELADRDKNGYLSFRELFNILVIFMKGEHSLKLQYSCFKLK